MEMDRDIDAALLLRAGEAAVRWQLRKSVREGRTRALGKGDPLGADTPSRLAARVNNLVGEVRRASARSHMPSNPVLRGFVERQTPVVAEEITREIVNEAIIGAADFLSVEFLERGVAAARSVGRVLIGQPGLWRARGTGFLVGPGLAMTNQHVLTSAGMAANCALQMDYEQSGFGVVRPPQEFRLEPERFFLADEGLDFALVAVAATSARGGLLSDHGWLPLVEAQGKISISDKDHINIIQHPRGEEKQVVLRDNRVLDMRTGGDATDDQIGAFLHYQADTDKGSSGSPVMSDTWQVVALHHSGVPEKDAAGRWLNKQGKPWIDGQDRVEDISWIANEAVRISGILGFVKSAQLVPAARAFVDTALGATPGTPAEESAAAVIGQGDGAPVRLIAKDEPDGPLRIDAGSVSFDIPLRVTLSLGPARPRVPPAEPARQMPAVLERIDPAQLADRGGYAPGFLGFDLPLPAIRDRPRFGGLQAITQPARPDDSHELRYHGYSVLMCAGRRLAYLSACNADFLAPVQVPSEEGGGGWRFDPRMPSASQIGRSYYLGNDLDRGHLSRRNDLARGETRAIAIARNRDSFFWTNCAPQHFLLNQSDRFTGAALQLWGDLEDHIAAQGAQNGRLSIFNGPVFSEADLPYRDALVPLAFYKIAVWNDADGPGAVGFVLEQGDLLASLAQEAIDPGAFSIRQRRIAAIGADLDLDLAGLAALDRMPASTGRGRTRSAANEALAVAEILSVADILFKAGG